MKINLTKDETLVKEWDYARQKKLLGFKNKYNLTLTNKRIIATKTLKKGVEREDILLSSVTGVGTSRTTGFTNLLAGILLIIIGIALIASLIALAPAAAIIGVVLIVLGIIVLIVSRNTKLVIELYETGIPFNFISLNTSLRFKRRIKLEKVKVDAAMAEDICNNINELILKNKVA